MMNKQKTFTEFVASKYPNDTAVKENYSESDLIDFYPDLWDAFNGGFNCKQEHILSQVKDIDDVHEYLETVVQEDHSISDVKYSIELLLSRIKDMENESQS